MASDTTDNTTASITNSTISELPITSIQTMVRHELQQKQRKTIIRKEIRKQLLKKNKKDNKKRTAEKTKKRWRRKKVRKEKESLTSCCKS